MPILPDRFGRLPERQALAKARNTGTLYGAAITAAILLTVELVSGQIKEVISHISLITTAHAGTNDRKNKFSDETKLPPNNDYYRRHTRNNFPNFTRTSRQNLCL